MVLVCLEQHQSPSCVLFTLYSVDPVMNVMHFIDLGSQKKTWSQNIYSAFFFDVQIFFVHVIPLFFFLSDGDQPFLLFCVWTAPEVLSGGPYNHAADWWSLGIMLFSLAEGEVMTRRLNMFELVCVSYWSLWFAMFLFQFPVPAELDHSTMLKKVKNCPYVVPNTFSSALALLLTEVCKRYPLRLSSTL